MKYIETNSFSQMSEKAADIISAQIKSKPDSVLGFATGSTPLGIYKQLIKRYESGELDFSKITTFNLDEYKGLSPDDIQSYRYYMDNNLFKHINIDMSNTFVPNGIAEDINAECADYDAKIEKLGGIDLQLLGIGEDGHIGFNEPCGSFIKDTHVVKLDESTIKANSRFFDNADSVPRQAVTMGMLSIIQAKKILLVASGEKKRNILKKAFEDSITPFVPASILQLHKDVTVIYSTKGIEDDNQ